jgi:hypothetical protein
MKRIAALSWLERRRREGRRDSAPSLSLVAGVVSLVTGFLAIALAWNHVSRTDQLWVQNQEVLSGGIGGLGMILLGVGLLIRDRLGRIESVLSLQVSGTRDTVPEQTEAAVPLADTATLHGEPSETDGRGNGPLAVRRPRRASS